MTDNDIFGEDALTDFADNTAADAAKTIDAAFSRAFGTMEKSIAKAATSGKLSIKDMVDSIVADLDRVALKKFVTQPIAEGLSSLVSSILPVSGARAGGGPVSADNAYLVGERGPELFVPASSGAIAANAAPATARQQVVLNVQTRDAASFRRSEGQLTAMMLRALRRGRRNV